MIAFNLAPELRKLPSAPDLARGGRGGALRRSTTSEARATAAPARPRARRIATASASFALDTMLKLPEGATRAQVDEAMDGHILGEGSLMGHFGH